MGLKSLKYPFINFFDDFHMAWKKLPHDSLRPFFQGLREDCVVCISYCTGRINIVKSTSHMARWQETKSIALETNVQRYSSTSKMHLLVTLQASSHPRPSVSINRRISSGIARVGCVSFSCTATLEGNSDHLILSFPSILSLNLAMMS